MIKDGAYIREFTPEQKQQLQAIADAQDIPSAKNILLFALDKYQAHINEIDRLKRFLDRKQQKIEALEAQINNN